MKTGVINAATDINAAPAGNFARYYGLATVRVVGVNPTKAEFQKLTGRELKDEPVYLQKKTDKDGKEYIQTRISVFVQTASPNDPQIVSQIDFWLANHSVKSQAEKYKVIDIYGNTSWVTKEEYSAKKLPVSKLGKALPITEKYELMYAGQDRLIDFMKAYLGIPQSFNWDSKTGEWVRKQDELLANCQCEFDDIKRLFNGDYRELKEIFSVNKDSLVKVLFGVRMADDGSNKSYQTVYDKAMPFFSLSTKALLRDIQQQKEAGRLSNYVLTDRNEALDEYIPEVLKEFVVPVMNNNAGPKGFSNEVHKFETPSIPTFGDGTPSNGDDLPF